MIANPALRDWLASHGVRALAVIVVVLLGSQALQRALPPALRHSIVRDHREEVRIEQLRRADTLIRVLLRTSLGVLLIVGAFFVLAELGFSIVPVVAGLGITGIALGLGAQTLVKDTINGLFILGEDQFGRGDIVTIAGVSGRVEEVSLRRTLLRADDGTLFAVPNSAITVSANHTRGYSGISFTVGVSFAADLEQAIHEVDRIGQELAVDPHFGPLVLEAPRALRVDSLEENYLNLMVSGRVAPAPGAQAEVSGEIRRRLIQDFDRLGIPYRGSPPKPENTE